MRAYFESKIIRNDEIQKGIYDMELEADFAKRIIPGQFVNVYPSSDSLILPRPISVCETNKEKGTIRIVYQVVGKGTKEFSELKKDESVNIAGPLGRGYTMKRDSKIAIIGGGMGVPPLLELTKALAERNNEIVVYNGFRNKDLVILEEDFNKLDIKQIVCTDDGSYGTKGVALNSLKEDSFKPDMIYSCGPKIMLKFVSLYAKENNIDCEVSLEERMGCGIGACYGCVQKVNMNGKIGSKKICSEGPVFSAKEVIWDD